MKKVVTVLLVLALMSTVSIVYAQEESQSAPIKGGSDSNKGAAKDTGNVQGKEVKKNQEGKEYLVEAWGRFGPIYLPAGYTGWWRVYYPYSCFIGTPSVRDSLEVPLPFSQKYSIGTDKGYSYPCRFDARVTTISGGLTGSYVNWHARR